MFKSWPVITTLAVLGLTSFASVALSPSAENDGIVRVASAVPNEERQTHQAGSCRKGHPVFQRNRPGGPRRESRHQAPAVGAARLGNPPLGTQFITANPNAGLDWPVRLLLTQDESGQVWAVYYRLRLDCPAPRNFEPGRSIQNGNNRRSVNHVDLGGQVKMRVEQFDVVVLGGGNGGLRLPGRRVRPGCPSRSSKTGSSAAPVQTEAARPKRSSWPPVTRYTKSGVQIPHCISVSKPELDWAALIGREKRLIQGIPERLEATLLNRGVELVRGKGRFVSPNAIRVGDRFLEAKHIVVATGSRPRPLEIPGAEFLKVSDDLLSAIELPNSIVFIGGGVISLEFGHVYSRAGVEVTILEVLPQLLPALDSDAVALLEQQSEGIGIQIETGVRIKGIQETEGQLRVRYANEGGDRSVDADWIVNGAGRVANIDQLDLAAATLDHAGGLIHIDPFLRSTSNPHVYVCGDVVPNSPQLSPIATYEGNIVGRNIVEGPIHRPDYASVPNSVYTVPALASLGLTERAAREKGCPIRVHKTDMAEWLSARTYAEPAAWAKIIVDDSSDQIIGAHLVGHSGEELINIFALAMAHGITAGDIKNKIYAYPTFSSDIKNLL